MLSFFICLPLLFRPKTPPIMPIAIIISDIGFSVKFELIMLEIRYIISMYDAPIIAPFMSPFFFSFLVPSELPISMLIPVMVIITGWIVSSGRFVYVSRVEKIIRLIIVNANANKIPFIILDNELFFSNISIF